MTLEETRNLIFQFRGKERLKLIKFFLSKIPSHEHKIKLLKNSMIKEKCFLLSCGPTLLQNDTKKLKEMLEETPCIAIKQSYDLFKDLVDIHVYNCCNYKKYIYETKEPIIIECSTFPAPIAKCDLKFYITSNNFDNSVSVTEEYDKWTLENEMFYRPYGPGIETEIIIFLLEHLGFSEVITVGWDNKIIGNNPRVGQHFYSLDGQNASNFTLDRHALEHVSLDSITKEEKISINAIDSWYNWLKEKGCTIKICSAVNPAPEYIERVVI